MTLRCGLIGDPVAHSQSPAIHAAFAEQTGLALSYEAIPTPSEALAATVQGFFAEGGHGLNVTLPHKQAVLALCAEVAPAAQRASSVNTLSRSDAGISGRSTDGPGLIADLRRLDAPLAGANILLLGAGGAARAVVEPLLACAPAELVWSHRNPLKLEGQETKFAGLGRLRLCADLALKGDRFDLILHATAAGHSGRAPLLPNGILGRDSFAYDLSYGDAALPFLSWAQAQGAARQADGQGMLIEQAALSFQHWTGQQPDTASLHC